MKSLGILVVFICLIPLYQLFGSDHNKLQKPDTISKVPLNWYNLDPAKDNFIGVSTERAYRELLKNKKPGKVVVAILDSGIDILHEDLKDNIWTNTDEIPGNSIDDDKNGYVDDVHGWNFIGGRDGRSVENDTYEVTRLYARYRSKFEGRDTTAFSGEDSREYMKYLKIRAEYEQLKRKDEGMLSSISSMKERYDNAEKIVKSYLRAESISLERLREINTEVDSITLSAEFLLKLLNQNFRADRLQTGIEKMNNIVNYSLNPDFDPRSIVGDDYSNPDDRYYGNNLVKGLESSHGTHVAGVIAAVRNNDTGVEGITDNVELMAIRVVPDGDERDKDVANGIYYAVDNGARIINMSFGKSYSPYKEYVDKAFKYAEDHGVLIVHASGNDSENIDSVANYPSRRYLSGKECRTWIEVGATTWKKGNSLVAGFSNYGKKSVDLFAPGVEIYSTIPDNQYRSASGTSMSAPVVTGVAALVWSYYPQLTAEDLKTIILKSAISYKRQKVYLPGNPGEKVRFGSLSVTGGVVNAYKALQMAEKMTRK